MSEDKKNAAPAQGGTSGTNNSEKPAGGAPHHKHYGDKRKHYGNNKHYGNGKGHGGNSEHRNEKGEHKETKPASDSAASHEKNENSKVNNSNRFGDKKPYKPHGGKNNYHGHHKGKPHHGKPHPKAERPETEAEEKTFTFSESSVAETPDYDESSLLLDEGKSFAPETEAEPEAEAKREVEEPALPPEPRKEVEIVGIRFKAASKIYYFAPEGIKFSQNEGAIVETARGQEYGFIAIENRMVDESEIFQPLKSVIRKATPEDTEKHAKNKQQEARAAEVWAELVEKHKLVMNLTDVEYTFDNSKLIFYFTADGRIDFRELVKDLASVFRTRIELRQIGVRDEAKLVGGLGICGMPFCCNRFLSDFAQVSIKMAKEQNLSLSSSKISGNCGRLMCCLRYEQEVYEREYATFPKVDSIVQTPAGNGVITESNFLNGRIKVRMDGDGAATYKYFTQKEIKVIGRAKSSRDEIDKELKKLED